MNKDSSGVESQESKQKLRVINLLQTQKESSQKTSPETETRKQGRGQMICTGPPTGEGTHTDIAWDCSPISISLFPLPVERVISSKPRNLHMVVTDHSFLDQEHRIGLTCLAKTFLCNCV